MMRRWLAGPWTRLGTAIAIISFGLLAAVPLAAALASTGSPDAGASGSHTAISAPQLLSNPSFEQGVSGWSLWAASGQANWALCSGGAAQDRKYLQWNTGTSSSSAIVHVVRFSPAGGAGYRATVMLRSPSGAPATAQVVLWGLSGGTGVEQGETTVTVSSRSWQSYSAELDVGASGLSGLSFDVYLNTPGVNLDADAVTLHRTGLTNSSFEDSANGWSMYSTSGPGEAPPNWAAYSSSGADEDGHYLEFNSGGGPATAIYQAVSASPVDGHSYRGSIAVRSPTGARESLVLVLWGLKGSASVVQNRTIFGISGKGWENRMVDLDVSQTGLTGLQLELYLETPRVNLDADAAQLIGTNLTNPSFGKNMAHWRPTSTTETAVYSGNALEDSKYLEMNSGSRSSGSVSNQYSCDLVSGESYVASVYLRSPTSASIPVGLYLATLGKTAKSAVTSATVSSPKWTEYSVSVAANGSRDTAIRFRVEVEHRGVNLDMDAAGLLAGCAAPVRRTSSPGCTGSNSCSPTTFTKALLVEPGIKAPVTAPNLYAMETWYRAEGGGAGCPGQPAYAPPWSNSGGPAGNPLNTTQTEPGSTDWNSIGVQIFRDDAGRTCWYWGLEATWQTLINGHYFNIIHALRHPKSTDWAQCQALGTAVGSTPWGTGDFAADGDCAGAPGRP